MKRVKLFFLLLLLVIAPTNLFAYPWMKSAIFQNGIWYPWENSSGVKQAGTYNQFVAYSNIDDPSHFYFRITINNFSIPDKKTRKLHVKNDEWYEYSGYIEYWIDDEHLDFLSCLLVGVPIRACPWTKFDKTPSIIKKSPATIRIAPYNKRPETYNIWFEGGIGYAFYFYETQY